MRLRWVVVALYGVLGLCCSAAASAQNVAVSVGVGDTILSVSGRTSPNAFVTISRDGGVIGTTIADAAGAFDQDFLAQEPGLHEISVFAHTVGGDNTDTVTVSINITEHATTSVDIFLPPTLVIADVDLSYGQALQLRGEAAPGATVTIYIDNTIYSSVTAGGDGLWSSSLDTKLLASGQHSLFVRASDQFGAQSYPSAARSFNLAAQPVVPADKKTPQAPVITFPVADTIWREPTLTVTGTADGDVQVELWDGNDLIGSVWSNPEGMWSLLLQLEPRAYDLRARACIEGVCSDFSATVRFSYEPAGPVSPLDKPLRIKVPQASFSVRQRQPVVLRATVLDGKAPYTVVIHWDDGTTETRTYTNAALRFEHAYAKPGHYTVRVDVQDADGRTKRVYFSVRATAVRSWPVVVVLSVGVLVAAGSLLRLYLRRSRR